MERHHFKTVIVQLWLLSAPSLAMAQTDTINYVKSEAFINGSGGKVTTIQYYDGLGRPTLNATNSLGKDGKYVYIRQQYDYGDRVSEQSIRAYGGTTPVYTTSLNWMDTDTHRSTTYTYDACGRVTIEKGPGDLWHNGSHFKQFTYILNGASEVKLYSVSGNTLSQSGYYGQGKLTVERYTDENGHTSKVYKDMQGRTVMERRINGSVNYDTYYVYDYLGNLRYVLPPRACDSMTNGSWTISSTPVKRFGYYYEYDTRGRCTKKQLPGCDYVTMTYDTDDRLIASQDGKQRNASSPVTTYYEYDALGRQTVMGIEYTSGTKIPYYKIFYDDYTFLTSTELTKVGFDTSNGYESAYASAKGLQTGCRILHLDNPSANEVTAMYYNAYGEMIQQRSTNHLSGNDDHYIQYNHYTGKELYHKHIHSASGQTTHTEVYTYEYDTADQLHYIKHKLDNNSQVTISTITYDNIGRVVSKGASNSTQTYSYNIRDWVKKIEHSQFKEYISYNETSDDHVTPTNKSYNGNIGAIAWRAGSDTADRTYQFSYNDLDWLTAATYSGTGSYSTTYSYDKMGNLLTLKRYGKYNSSTYNLIDNLSYTYTGNQITKIEDASTYTPTYTGAFNFVNAASQSNEYTYDQNGNLTKDLNKNISSIGYNLLNLPTNITYSSGKSAAYVYDATGRKLRTSYKASASATAVPTDYCGNMIYENNVLKQILVDGGYITLSGTAPYYHYYLKDHLGNNRVVVSPAGTAEQINHYYPFGGLFGESTGNTVQRFRYNGKEFDRTHGIDWYDYGARHMTPDAGRFTTIDPMAEKYYSISPYAYCANNPVNAIDSDGELIIFINGFHFGFEGGNPSYWKTDKGDFDKMVMQHFGDSNVKYYDGSLGGPLGIGRSLLSSYREMIGQLTGILSAADIISGLRRDQSGNIIESVKVISHSMGGSFAKGFVRALINYTLSHPDEANGLSISEYDFAPFETTFQTAVKGVDTYQYSHINDGLAGYQTIHGANKMKTSTDQDKGHYLRDFIQYIYNLPSGSYVFENGQFISK